LLYLFVQHKHETTFSISLETASGIDGERSWKFGSGFWATLIWVSCRLKLKFQVAKTKTSELNRDYISWKPPFCFVRFFLPQGVQNEATEIVFKALISLAAREFVCDLDWFEQISFRSKFEWAFCCFHCSCLVTRLAAAHFDGISTRHNSPQLSLMFT
jgi:hypothetical protein